MGRPGRALLALLAARRAAGSTCQSGEEPAAEEGSILLQVQGWRERRAVLGDVCDAESLAFDGGLCNEVSVGVKHPRQLLGPGAKDLPPGRIGLLATGEEEAEAKCNQTFYVLKLEEAEQMQPALATCLVSTWAAKFYVLLQKAACAAKSLEDASIVVLPGYTATECNWPIYNGGDCTVHDGAVSNLARRGRLCRGEDVVFDLQQLQAKLKKRTVVLENSPNNTGNKYDLATAAAYADGGLSWALVGTDAEHYRESQDISLPPGPSTRCDLTLSPRLEASFAEGLEKKRFLASFKGNMRMHYSRVHAAAVLHDGAQVIVSDKSDPLYDFDELLYSSVFALILRGDAIMTTRVNEAICSGGIPVLVTGSADRKSAWVPPFQEVMPFESFGLMHDEKDIETLRPRLDALSKGERERLRQGARRACEHLFQNIEAHARALSLALGKIRP